MKIKKYFKKSSITTLTVAMVFSTGMMHFNTNTVHAASFTGTLSNVLSASVDENDAYVVNVNFNDQVQGKITFLENGIFRYNVDPEAKFAQYATPNSTSHKAKIQAQPDDSDYYSHPGASVTETADTFEISSEGVTISLDKVTAKMTVKNSAGEVILQESAPLTIEKNSTIQTLTEDENEYYYGGGTQNGRFSHKGKSIKIVNESAWTDGGVASPNPFYWSTKGYGVIRNTFKQGVYNFGSDDTETVTTKHNETEFDAYYVVAENDGMANKAEEILNGYYKVTGSAVQLPEYSYYLAHLNCYNRDGWQESSKEGSGWKLEDGKWYTELGKAHDYKIPDGTKIESLNNEMPTLLTDNFGGVLNEDTYKFSARAVIDGYANTDTPLGWFLPNDGYGCGYGQNGYYEKRDASNPEADLDEMYAAVDANVANLKSFVDYAATKGVKVGLWTQSALDPLTSEMDRTYYHGYQNLRDFNKEVNDAGVVALKTDVAWVGSGYSFALNSTKTGYDTVAKSGVRPNLVSLDGWAGSQRYTGVWTGDQTGGNWEYIRFHIPTYIGQTLSGNPNVGSDINGIFGSGSVIQARDIQWKTFTQLMLDMDGWGTEAKKPYYHGDPYTGMNRMYLKLKAELMPYLYSEGFEAVDGLPSIRAMFLEFPEDPNTYGDMVKYQYMYGSNFLVAPVYEDVNMDEEGNDVRNGIYLPGNDQVWIDYFTGKQYQGGKILNGFDAPVWKLPLFVKNGAIVPMYEENNNPEAITEANPKGLNKANRVVEFWPEGETSYNLNEDDGISLNFEDNGEDTRNTVDYGDKVNTVFTSSVEGDVATLTANPSTGTYEGYDSNRKTTFVVNVQEKPTSVTAFNGSTGLTIVEADTLDEYNELANDDTKTVYFYDANPNLNKYAQEGESFKDVKVITTPKLYVKFARTDVTKAEQKLVINGFNNTQALDKDVEIEELKAPANIRSNDEAKTPTSITIEWDAVKDATSYEVLENGNIYSSGFDSEGTPYLTLKQSDLTYSSTHNYQVRSRNANGYSAWSPVFEVQTQADPYRNIPTDMTMTLDAKTGYKLDLVTDRDTMSTWFSNYTEAEELKKIKTFTFDFKENYQMDRVEIYSDSDIGGGYYRSKPSVVTVKRSMDNVHWETLYDNYQMEYDGQLGIIDLKGNTMRYLSITANKPANSYIALAEIMPHKVDGSKSVPVGSNNGQPVIDENSMTQIRAYSGAYEGSSTWGQVKDADINLNGVYDVYDMSYVLFQMDGGTKQKGTAAGNILFMPDKKNVSAGETYTVDMYGVGMENVNAVGGVFTYDSTKFEVVSVEKNDILSEMGDFTINQEMGEGQGLLSMAYMNRGDKALVSGTSSLATITLKAKVDTDVYTPTEAMLIGPNYSVKMTNSNVDTGELPDIPTTHEAEYTQDDFNLTMTNEFLPTDDGKNVEKLIQQNNYNNLFNDVTSYVDGSVFELKWNVSSNFVDGKLPEYVTLPLTLHYELKEPNTMTKIDYYNRASGNGTISKLKAQVFFEDGTTQDFAFDTTQTLYSMVINEENLNKNVTKVDITPLEAKNMQMLTICEINLFHTEGVEIEDIVLSEGNPSELNVGDMVEFNATVLPDNISNPYYYVESDDTGIVDVIRLKDGDTYTYLVKAVAEGTANIKVTAAGDPTKSVETTITVKGSETEDDLALEKEMLRNAIVKAESITDEEMSKLAPKVQALINDSYDAAVAVLKNAESTQAQILEAWLDLANALHYADFKADKTDLNELIEICNKLVEEDYSAGFDVMKAALEEAIAVNADENALQARIDTTYTTLLNAYNALVKNENTGIETLTKLVDALGDIDGSKYCQNEAWSTFTKAFNDAKALLEKDGASASEIHSAIIALTSAYEDIRLLPDESVLAQLESFIEKVNSLDMNTYSAEHTARFMAATSKARMMVEDPNTYDPAILTEINELNTIIDNEQIVEPEDPQDPDGVVVPEVNEPSVPEEPTTTQQPTETKAPAKATGTAATGDVTNMVALLGLALASGTGVYVANKKRKEKK